MFNQIQIRKLGLFLTQRCNFKCIYCCTKKGDDPPDKLTFSELQDLLLQAKRMGCWRLVISGAGEPMLDEFLVPLIVYARKIRMECEIFTNGSLIDKKIAAWFWAYRVNVFIKLDSMNPATQDFLTQRSSQSEWDNFSIKQNNFFIPRGLKYLLEAGYVRKGFIGGVRRLLWIATVITRFNIKDILDIVHFCSVCGLGIYIEDLLPLGRSKTSREIFPTEEETLKLYKKIRFRLNLASQFEMRYRCPFETEPFFDVNGDIRFCFGLKKSVGNIREKSLRKLHIDQLRLKAEFGALSPVINFNPCGFGQCRTRRMLKIHIK